MRNEMLKLDSHGERLLSVVIDPNTGFFGGGVPSRIGGDELCKPAILRDSDCWAFISACRESARSLPRAFML